MKLSRKDFFKGIAIGTISLPFAIRAIGGKSLAQNHSKADAISDRVYNWKMVTTWPPNFPVVQEGCELFAEWVREMSSGRMNIEVYGGGELVPALEVFGAVQSGVAEVGSGAGYYWAGKVPAAQFFATVPFGMNAQQMNAWLLHGGGLELWEELYADFNLIPMPGGNTGVQMGGWFNKEINTIDDFRGLKMRMPGLGGKVLERAGGTPVLLAGGEIYTGLERGVLDATEWIGPFHDYQMGFHQIAKYYYAPGWHEPGTVLEIIFNKERFEELPADLQQILRTATLRLNQWMFSEIEAKNAEYLARIQALDDIEVRTFSPEILKTLREITADILDEITTKDPFAAKVYASYDAFRKKSALWASYTEKIFYDTIEEAQ